MTRRGTAVVFASAALVVGLALASVVLLFGGAGGAPVPTRGLSAKATLSSRTILFGDEVAATLDLVVPRATAGSGLSGHPDFSPFQIVSSHVERTALGGGLERISLRYDLTCLTVHCLSAGPLTQMRFRPTVVSVPGHPLRAVWPSLVQVSRLQEVSRPVTDGLDAGPASLPGLHPRRDAYEALGAAGASLVVLLAAWLYLRRRAERRRALLARRGSVLQALLARVEAGLPEDVIYRQRHALDALAVELRHRRVNGSLAMHAERLAWAPEEPDPEAIRALCAEVRRLSGT